MPTSTPKTQAASPKVANDNRPNIVNRRVIDRVNGFSIEKLSTLVASGAKEAAKPVYFLDVGEGEERFENLGLARKRATEATKKAEAA